jgi:simple sugar transport system permease protein
MPGRDPGIWLRAARDCRVKTGNDVGMKVSNPNWLNRIFGRTEAALGVAIVLTAVVLSIASPYFLTLANLVDLVEAYSVTTILAAGVFVVLVSGGIDISFTATASATQYLAAYLIASQIMAPVPALFLAAVLGIAMGAINALLTHFLRVVSIIVTIATSSIYYALLIYITNAEELYNLPDWWSNRIAFFRYETADGDIVKITLPIVVMVVVLGLTQVLMGRTRIGRQVYALGGNPEAASRVGINILKVQLFAYGYLGLLAAIAGFIQAGRVHQAVPTAMNGQELNTLAVAILGGASLVGGVGSTGGVVLGVLFLAMLQNGLNLLGVSSYFFGVVTGLAILVSIGMTGTAEKHARRRVTGA